jgi:hypothetical protein
MLYSKGGTTFDHLMKHGIKPLVTPGLSVLKPDCILEKSMYSGKIPVHRRFNYSSCEIVSAEKDYYTLRGWTRANEHVRSEQRKHFVTMLREPYARLLSQFDHNQVSLSGCYVAIIRYT